MIGAILAAGSLILSGTEALLKHGAQNANAKANKDAANDAFSETSRQLAIRQEQDSLAASQSVYALGLDATQRQGSLGANAASSGVAGNTVDALSADLMRSEYNARDVVDRNLAMTQQQIDQQRQSAAATRDARIAGVPGASSIETAANIGGALTAFGYDWLKLRAPSSKV